MDFLKSESFSGFKLNISGEPSINITPSRSFVSHEYIEDNKKKNTKKKFKKLFNLLRIKKIKRKIPILNRRSTV